ncbi:hypothetical protein EXIGLDRAFT_121712 [Exidia glandulosa HHB12029]|uniref:Uncharacterized protein n=1 Tax=Exidia glandulosa HHB12029 TaxID=1314781 RepID=A0A165GE31_EXIGL|nr:hypothetical protein EXIGLDRAFT_121712 [Exidia glandulosa HHB12029]
MTDAIPPAWGMQRLVPWNNRRMHANQDPWQPWNFRTARTLHLFSPPRRVPSDLIWELETFRYLDLTRRGRAHRFVCPTSVGVYDLDVSKGQLTRC